MSIVVLKNKMKSKRNISNNEIGFSLYGKKNISGTVSSDSNLANQHNRIGCCSDNGTHVKKSVTGTKGMLQSKKYRNDNCCPKTENQKLCDKKSFKKVETISRSASEVTTNIKNRNEICAKMICTTHTVPISKSCVAGCDKHLHINHGNGITSSSSDYIELKKARNEVAISKDESTLSCVE